MGGVAPSTGIPYQAGVIAFVYVYMLARLPLEWLERELDIPIAISAETGGPGDDARVEVESGRGMELQAKRGLRADKRLLEAVDRVASAHTPDVSVVIVVDRTSSNPVKETLRDDLRRLRNDRRHPLHDAAKKLIDYLSPRAEVLNQVHIARVDIIGDDEPQTQTVLQLLRNLVVDPDTADAAWAFLCKDAAQLSAKQDRRDRQRLVDLLEKKRIKLKGSSAEEFWRVRLDIAEKLLDLRQSSAVEAMLIQFGATKEPRMGRDEQYRFEVLLALSALQQQKKDQALAHATRALDIKRTYSALQVTAFAALADGDRETAQAYAREAAESEPANPRAWVPLVVVSADAGLDLPEPPAAVAPSARYQRALALAAFLHHDWDAVLQHTAACLEVGERHHETLWLRAHALVNKDDVTATQRGDNLRSAIELATEVLEAGVGGSQASLALSVRTAANGLLGNKEASRADAERALQLDRSNQAARLDFAQRLFLDGRLNEAAAVLVDAQEDADPLVLALRGLIAAETGNSERAAADLDNVIPRIGESGDPDAVRIRAADIATTLGRLDDAERLLAQLRTERAGEPEAMVQNARVAFRRGEAEAGADLFRRCAEADANRRADYLLELAFHLARAGQMDDAVVAFKEAGGLALPPDRWPLFARALYAANDFAGAMELVDRVAQEGPLPVWALEMAADIALLADDVDAAIRHLRGLVDRGVDRPSVRLTLAEARLELGERSAAEEQLSHMGDGASPVERMRAAWLLAELGRVPDAYAEAYSAFRADPDDPELQRALASLIFLRPTSEALTVGRSGPGTFIRRSDGKGRSESYFICIDDQAIDRWRHEITASEAAAKDLLAKSAGDESIDVSPSGRQRRWHVDEVKPAVIAAAQDIVAHFNERFPDERFLAEQVDLSDGQGGLDLVPMIEQLSDRRSWVREVLRQQREQVLPLGFVAGRIGVGVADLIEGFQGDDDEFGPLLVESPSADDQRDAVVCARQAAAIVLTRSALQTASGFGLLDHLANHYQLIAPRALETELRRELAERQSLVDSGWKHAGVSPAGLLSFDELPAGNEVLVQRRDEVAELLSWARAHVTFRPRPLRLIPALGSQLAELRDALGQSSFDSSALAVAEGLPLYVDDLGLRRRMFDTRPASFSTITLIEAWTEDGTFTGKDADRLTVRLAANNYAWVRPSMRFVRTAMVASLSGVQARRAFRTLACPTIPIGQVADMVIRVARDDALAQLSVISLPKLLGRSMEGMRNGWSPLPVSAAMRRAADNHFDLMPGQRSVVDRATTQFLQRYLTIDPERQ